MIRKLFLLLFGLVAGLVLAELAVRGALDRETSRRFDTRSPTEHARWIGHPFLPYAGRPNAEITLINDADEEERITTNRYGFRSEEFATANREASSDDTFDIFCFGGSTTYGYKVPGNEGTWPNRLQTLLREEYPQRNVRVFNLGVDMATTAFSVVNATLIAAPQDPDLVIVYHGYNDADAFGAGNFRPDHSHFYRDVSDPARRGLQNRMPRWLDPSRLVRVATGFVDLRNGTNDLAVLATTPRLRGAEPLTGLPTTLQNLDLIAAIARGRGAKTLFSTFQFRDGHAAIFKTLNEEFRRHFAERGYAYVDQDLLLADGDPSINVDPCHFTPEGRQQVAQNFFDAIVANRFVEDAGD